MSENPDLRSAVAAGTLGGESTQRALLTSIVEVARAIFAARASSIMLHDAASRELRFAAVAGEGSDHLVGTRLPDSTGIAGWVLAARQPIVLDDVAADPRFARDAAEATGFVPSGLMAVPLRLEDRILGVLSVLDRPERSKFTLPEMDLLAHFAYQAALAIELAEGAKRAQAVMAAGSTEIAQLAALATRIERLEPRQRAHALALISDLNALLGSTLR
jgi:GAF domain-containing protein